ncbi:hypothetical protein [Pseudomonas frederiksbergensis]|uniref:hypothetical protein n=1 Tax=Pseudomonas frederiksbergensis TaxID=104087 RepID=UPI003D1DA629
MNAFEKGHSMTTMNFSVRVKGVADHPCERLPNAVVKIARLNKWALLALAMSAFTPLAMADIYEISVTRKGANLYKVDGKEIFIRTQYCYEYAYSETAILEAYGTVGDLKFVDSSSECPVKAIFGKSKQTSGKYAVQVSQDNDDWYEVYGQGIYIHTNGCFSMAMNEDATLDLSAGGYGSLLIDGDQCSVEGIYSKLKL